MKKTGEGLDEKGETKPDSPASVKTYKPVKGYAQNQHRQRMEVLFLKWPK